MKFTALLLVSLLALSLSGCFIPSVGPLYDDETAVLVDNLPGTYKAGDSNTTNVITRGEGKSYVVTSKDGKGQMTLKAVFVKVGDQYFVDWEMPVEKDVKLDPPLKVMHLVNRVVFDGKTLKFYSFEDDKFMNLPDLKTQEFTSTKTRSDGTTRTEKEKLVNMPPKQFQAFVKAHAAEITKLQITWEKTAN